MKSVWKNDNPQYKPLSGDITADVLIIGGGISGILCAMKLKERNINYVLLEGKTILSGNTGNTTAKITAGQGLIYHKILKKYGKETAKAFYYANIKAIKKYKALSSIYPCDFCEKDLYIYSRTDYKKLHKEFEALRAIGADVEFAETDELLFVTKGAVKHKNQAQFNPIKFLSAIAKELNIYEHSFVHSVKGNTAFCQNGSVTFKKVIFTTHFPIINKFGLYFLKMYQHRSFVVALKNAKQLKGMYVDEDDSGMSFRNYKDYLLIAGGGARTGKKYGGFDELERVSSLYYPQSKIEYQFAAQDCMTLDSIPYIGRYTYCKDNYFVATGFNTWGMTNAMIAAELLCDMIEEKGNNLYKVFNPQRSMFHPQLFVNIIEAIINLVTPTVPRCSHMGCALKWNKEEKTWDCPCHGSRYTKDGKLLESPTTKNKLL